MIGVTGDIHGDPSRLEEVLEAMRRRRERSSDCAEGVPGETHRKRKDASEDYVLIAGDFGFGMENPEKEMEYLARLEPVLAEERLTVAFADGNHENFRLLNSLPVTQWHGGAVHMLQPHVLHLMRGQSFLIQDRRFFVMGGAASTDKAWRRAYELETGIPIWFPEELPNEEEYQTAAATLKANDSFDYIVSHTAPRELVYRMGYYTPLDMELTGFLEWVMYECRYSHWYFGHFHDELDIDEKHTCLFKRIVTLE